jgi:hypothetical protein
MSIRKLRGIGGGLAVTAIIGALVLTANAESQPADQAAGAPAVATQPATQPAEQAEATSSQAMMRQCMGMMKKMGMSQEMMDRMGVMMQTPIFMDSPCAVYGQADRLGLTDEQKSRLVEIEDEARKQSLAVLTDGQRKMVESAPEGAMPMAQMRQKMFEKMKPMMRGMGGQGMGGPGMSQMPMNCPMCPGMMGGMAGGTPSVSNDGDKGEAVKPNH